MIYSTYIRTYIYPGQRVQRVQRDALAVESIRADCAHRDSRIPMPAVMLYLSGRIIQPDIPRILRLLRTLSDQNQRTIWSQSIQVQRSPTIFGLAVRACSSVDSRLTRWINPTPTGHIEAQNPRVSRTMHGAVGVQIMRLVWPFTGSS